ncbi:MAG: hypothetical protein WAS05_05590 [Candidatus Nanopelagicales bacterium]
MRSVQSVVAAPFVLSSGVTPQVLVARNDGAGLVCVDYPSDWLAYLGATRRAENTVKAYVRDIAVHWRWCVDTGLNPMVVSGIGVQFISFGPMRSASLPANGCADAKVLNLGTNTRDRNIECAGCSHFVADTTNLRAMTAEVHQLRLTIARIEGELDVEYSDEKNMRMELLRIDLGRWKVRLGCLTQPLDQLSPAERNEVMLAADVIIKACTSNGTKIVSMS